MKPFRRPTIVLAWIAMLALAGCTADDSMVPSSGNASTGSGTGTLAVMLHDQAAPEITAARITLSSAEAREAGTGTWVDLGIDLTAPMDLLEHVGPDNALTIATALVPGTTYDAVRLTVVAVEVELAGSPDPVAVPVPAGGVTAAVAVPPFTVGDGGSVTVVLDMSVDGSFQVVGTDVVFAPAVTLTEVRSN